MRTWLESASPRVLPISCIHMTKRQYRPVRIPMYLGGWYDHDMHAWPRQGVRGQSEGCWRVYDFCGLCESRMCTLCDPLCINITLCDPHWCGDCDVRIATMCSPFCYYRRLTCPVAYRDYSSEVVQAEGMTPCTWCGVGTHNSCESCDRSIGHESAICPQCNASFKMCRLCRAAHYVKGLTRNPRRPREAPPRLRGERCAKCDSPAHKRCLACRMPYCGRDCQEDHWRQHKPICRLLKGAIPVYTIYPWHLEVVEALHDNTEDQAAKDRFRACFGGERELHLSGVYVLGSSSFTPLAPPQHNSSRPWDSMRCSIGARLRSLTNRVFRCVHRRVTGSVLAFYNSMRQGVADSSADASSSGQR